MSIRVTACLNPFSNEKTEYTFDSGISVKEIIKKIDTLNAVNTGWRVLFDDEIVTDFERKPEENQHVYIKLVPEGDNKDAGNGMKIGGGVLIAIGAVIGIATSFTGVGAFVGAALIGAGVGALAGGIVLYNTEIPDITPNRKKQETPEQDPSIRGSRNQSRPFGIVPCLLGKRRIYADLAAKNYTWVENGSAYLYQLFCVGQSDLTIDTSTIKIDETLLTDYSQTGDISKILSGEDPLIDMRIHQDGNMPVLYDKCVHEEQINTILKHIVDDNKDGSIIRTTPEGTTEINVDIFFYNGLGKYNNDGSIGETSVNVRVLYKEKDEPDSAYKLFDYFTQTQKEVSQSFIIHGLCTMSTDEILDNYSRWQGMNNSPMPNYDIRPYITQINPGGKNRREMISWFDVWWKSPDVYIGTPSISGSELKTKRFSITKSDLKPAAYTIKISRTSPDSTDTKVVDDVYVGSIRAAKKQSPVSSSVRLNSTLIELKIKATEKLNNVVDRLNFVAQSRLPVYSGNGSGASAWSYALSSNPASAAIYAMQGGFAQQKLPDSEIDWPLFEKLYQWCENHKYECNAYITESMPISTLLSSIASTCRAEIFRMNGKVTVIQDIERESFTQLFTPRNSHDYSEDILLASVPDAMNLNIVDKDAGYAENQIRIYNTPSGEYDGAHDIIQEVSLWGVTDNTQARKLGMYNYAVTNHRAIIHRFSADFEYLMCQKGDWIKYAGDIALAGITQGRIASVLLNDQNQLIGFECDEEIPMESGKSYGMRVRKQNGVCIIFYLANEGTSSKTVALLNPESVSDTTPDEGDLFTFGEVEGAKLEDAIDLIVTDIQCGENLSADLTCVEYSPEIFGVDEEGFVLPAFESKISEVGGTIDAGFVTETWKTYFTYHDGDTAPELPKGDGTNAGWHHTKTIESVWVSSKTAASIYEGAWSSPAYVRGPQGEQGERGPQGEQGPSGLGISVQYSETGSGDWHTTFNPGQDLYMRQSTDEGTTWTDAIRITGENGKDGSDGNDGTSVTITSKSVTYQEGTSGRTPPSGSWDESVPNVAPGRYLWTKTVVTYSDGNSTTAYSVGYSGINGTDGNDGSDGISLHITQGNLTFHTRRDGSTNYESFQIAAILYEGDNPVTSNITASLVTTGASGISASGSLSDGIYTMTISTAHTTTPTAVTGSVVVSFVYKNKTFQKNITLQGISGGSYLGLASSTSINNDGSGKAVINSESSVNKDSTQITFTLGDYVSKSDTNCYTYACTAANTYGWIADNSDTAIMTALTDILKGTLSAGSIPYLFVQRIAANTAFINKLFAQYIAIGNSGAIYGGNRYKSDGSINNIAADGFWIGANGVLKARLVSDAYNGVYIGTNAGKNAVSSSENVFIGTSAGENVTGASNVAIGTDAMKNAVKTSFNIAVGYQALQKANSTENGFNTAVGFQSLQNVTTGQRNTGVGELALGSLTTGSDNVAIGSSLFPVTQGNYNIGIGYATGSSTTTGSQNIFIGKSVRAASSFASQDIIIGNGSYSAPGSSQPGGSGKNIIIGNDSHDEARGSSWYSDNIIIGNGIRPPDLDLGDTNGSMERSRSGTINIANKIRYLPTFYLANQTSLMRGNVSLGALILPENVFCKSGSIYSRLDGVKEYSFGTNSGYIRYANGLIIQWGTVTINNSVYTKVPIIAMTSYNVFITGKDLSNSIGGRGYLGYVNQLNSEYFYLSMSDIDFNHYPVSVQWIAIGY